MIWVRAALLITGLAIAAGVVVGCAFVLVIDLMPVDGPAVQTVPVTTQTPAPTRQ